jgi:hypothetical protein
MTSQTFRSQLQQIIDDEPNSIKAYIAKEALDHDDPEQFLEDVRFYGCVSGLVSSLIYYADTHAFYDRYYEEIENLREDYEDMTGEPLQIKGDLKNFFA